MILYTDGSCLGNPGPGGRAWSLYDDNYSLIHEDMGAITDTTNNQMELYACISGLTYFQKQDMSQTLVSVYTDSKYVQLGLQSIDQRRARAWKTSNRKPIKHKAMRQVLALLNTQVHCQRSWVKAHHLSQPNQRVDMLARGQASRIQAHPEIRRVLDTCYLDQAQYHSDKLF